MHKGKEQIYQQIKDIKSKEEFEKDLSKIKKEFDGLFNDEISALLILDELGRNKENSYKIKELKPGIDSTIYGKVTKINQSRNFNRKNGSTGRVVNLELTDETGTCGLALWDKDVELVKNKTITNGTNLKIINGYIKDGYNGIEINVGRWSVIEIKPDIKSDYKIKKQSISGLIKGKLTEIEPTRAFFKDNGEFGFVTNIKVENNKEIKQITVWGEKVKEIQKLKKGESIEIEEYDIKEKNGLKELHINSKGIIKKI
jgi:replication factor A1